MHRCKGCSNKNTGECHRWCMVKMRNIRKLLWSSKDNFVLLYSGVSLVWEIGLGHFLEKEWLEPLQLHSLIRYPSSIVSSQFFPLVSHRHNRTNKKKNISPFFCVKKFDFLSSPIIPTNSFLHYQLMCQKRMKNILLANNVLLFIEHKKELVSLCSNVRRWIASTSTFTFPTFFVCFMNNPSSVKRRYPRYLRMTRLILSIQFTEENKHDKDIVRRHLSRCCSRGSNDRAIIQWALAAVIAEHHASR